MKFRCERSLAMKLVVFGLTVSSSWGNGHATLWRGLIRALGRCGWEVEFYERDTPYYAEHRDLRELEGGRLRLYADWADVSAEAAAAGLCQLAATEDRMAIHDAAASRRHGHV
jgi:hypothetical protein